MPDARKRLEEIIAKLKARGNRITPQRIAVLKVLAASADHPSVEQIYATVRRDFPTTSIASVYKTIELLKEAGEVLELEFSGSGNRYDGNKPYPHPHLVCVNCGKILDPEVGLARNLVQEVARSSGYQIVSHRLDFYGLCPDCQKRV
jgi:Fur family transcriptional regulator, peroxide stress response regulator